MALLAGNREKVHFWRFQAARSSLSHAPPCLSAIFEHFPSEQVALTGSGRDACELHVCLVGGDSFYAR